MTAREKTPFSPDVERVALRLGGGYVAHDVGTTSAEAAVAAGAVAITYLADRLPART